jgi:general stress protein YciG
MSDGEQPMPAHKPRGFALLPKDKLLRVAASGGKVAHRLGLAHKFTSAEAASAGRLGGNSVSKNREHMSCIGKAGGESRAARAKLTAEEHRLLHRLKEGMNFVCKTHEESGRALIYGPSLDGKPPLAWPIQARAEVESLFRLGLITEATGSFLSDCVQLLLTPKGVRAVAVRRHRAAEAIEIGSLIRRLRQEGGLTRRALSAQTNLAETMIRELELGRLALTRELLAGLLRSPVMAALLEQARAVGVLALLQ